MENLDQWIGTTDVSITNRMQEMEERNLGIEDTINRIIAQKTLQPSKS